MLDNEMAPTSQQANAIGLFTLENLANESNVANDGS